MITASIYGRLGGDPVEGQTRKDNAMATVSIAVNAASPGSDEETVWVSLTAFGKAGEAPGRHAKGDLVAVMWPLYRTRFTGRDRREREGWSLMVEALVSARTVRSGGRLAAPADASAPAGDGAPPWRGAASLSMGAS